MDHYLLIPFLVGWTSIYQLFWCSPGVQGFDTLPYVISSIYQLFWCSPGVQGFDTLPYVISASQSSHCQSSHCQSSHWFVSLSTGRLFVHLGDHLVAWFPMEPCMGMKIHQHHWTFRVKMGRFLGFDASHRIHGAGIYSNIGGILMINVTIYSIHGSYGHSDVKTPALAMIFWYNDLSAPLLMRHATWDTAKKGP